MVTGLAMAIAVGVLVAEPTPVVSAVQPGISEVVAVPEASSSPTLAALDPAAGVVGLSPRRLLETRAGRPTVDGLERGAGRVGPGVIEVDVLGRGGVPASGVAAVMVNLTAVDALESGYATVFPCDGLPPLASSLNYPAGVEARGNEVLARLSSSGTVCVYALSSTQLVLDVSGYVPSVPEGVVGLSPRRLLETRAGRPTVDGLERGAGRVGPG
ncbi:MAG: hypothetical protein WBP59_04370, partial [Ilumatobacteraceae bacterium]